MVRHRSMVVLDNIVTMDESAILLHTPVPNSSPAVVSKGSGWASEGQGSMTRTKQMVLAFVDSEGLIYTNYVPMGTIVNASYIVEALGKFLKISRKKRLEEKEA